MAMALLWVLPSCEPTEDPLSNLTDKVTVATAEPTFITSQTATCGAEVTAENAGLLIEIGVCWSKSENPTVEDFVAKDHKCSKPYVCMLTKLEPNTKYHVRGFVKYGTEYCYGSEKTFTTLGDDVPVASPVTTLEAYDITYEGFACEVVVSPFGAPHWFPGVCYSRNPDITIDNCEGYSIGGFQDDDVYHAYCVCHGLMPNTQYYYRAFVAYGAGNYTDYDYFYGEVFSFITPEMPFILNLDTYNAYYSWSDYIVAYGRMECNQIEQIDQVGFCYSIDNEYPQYESDLHTTAATPTGEWYDFSSHIFNISANKKYYIRSYARYMTDSIKYGNTVSVDTY